MNIILIRDTHEVFVVDIEQLVCLQGAGRYTRVYIADSTEPKGVREIVTCRTLKEFEKQLSRYNFMRVSKSMIVALRFIYSVKSGTHIRLRHAQQLFVDLSPCFRKSFWQRLQPSSSIKKQSSV